jgi:hypothetical protein
LEVSEQIGPSGQIKACLQALDERPKTFTFHFDVREDQTLKPKTGGASLSHIQEAQDKLRKVQTLFEIISRNIYIKNDIDKELT